MVTVVCGDNTKESRLFLSSILESAEETVSFSQESVSMTEVAQAFDGASLFGPQNTVVFEDFLTKGRKSSEKDAILSYLATKEQDHDIVFWEGKDVTKTQLKQFSKPVLKQFSYPKIIFQFLDSIKPESGTRLIKLHQEVLANTEPEIVLFMLTRQIRLLLSASEKDNTAIDEWKRLSPWQRDKLVKQARLFSLDTLLSIHSSLCTIDRKQKTGELGIPLFSAIDFLLSAI